MPEHPPISSSPTDDPTPFAAHQATPAALVATCAVLLALLAASVGVSRLPLGAWGTALGLMLAGVKALLIAGVFMHLRFETALTRLFAAAGLVWVLVLFTLTLSDYLTR